MTLYRWLVRPILFRFDAEATHRATVAACEMVGRSALMRKSTGWLFAFDDRRLHIRVAGIDFKSPVTLAPSSGEVMATSGGVPSGASQTYTEVVLVVVAKLSVADS